MVACVFPSCGLVAGPIFVASAAASSVTVGAADSIRRNSASTKPRVMMRWQASACVVRTSAKRRRQPRLGAGNRTGAGVTEKVICRRHFRRCVLPVPSLLVGGGSGWGVPAARLRQEYCAGSQPWPSDPPTFEEAPPTLPSPLSDGAAWGPATGPTRIDGPGMSTHFSHSQGRFPRAGMKAWRLKRILANGVLDAAGPRKGLRPSRCAKPASNDLLSARWADPGRS